MCGRATLTTVESRKAMPDPSTVAASTHRPRADENASPASPCAAGGVDVVMSSAGRDAIAGVARREPVEDPPRHRCRPQLGGRVVGGVDQHVEGAALAAHVQQASSVHRGVAQVGHRFGIVDEVDHPLVPAGRVELGGLVGGVAGVHAERPHPAAAVLGVEAHAQVVVRVGERGAADRDAR